MVSGVNDIRATFLDYFAGRGHEKLPSSPLVPRNDPTLMFTNAGMVQFKNVFTGVEKRPYTRATTSQKCVRAGGKHNDLDNVGFTARHLTFFEMLGNFSFGDYFKADAIELAWTLTTKHFGMPKDRLLVTVYHDDDEAFGLWKKVAGLPDSRIIRIATSDNFWSMGDTGPCGPCSEIFIDQGDKFQGGPPGSPEEDGDRFLEFWNLVFMQYEQVAPGERVPLPRPSIDTGMGLERMAGLLQGVGSVFEIDTFQAIIRAIAEETGVDPAGPQGASHRVIADHLRTSAFLVADGVTPLNEGRGYVLRRIMRRAMRHAQLLGSQEPLMWKLVPVLVREMGQAYPELLRSQPLVTEALRTEESRFRATLSRGLAILEDETRNLATGAQLAGDTAFRLHDTFGFPLDLTQDALRARGIGVDVAGFDLAMARQRAEARKAWAGSGEAATETIWFGLRETLGATEFLGYDTETAEGVITAIVHDGQSVDRLDAGQSALVLVNQTPFYGESGGQVGDTGAIGGGGVHAAVRSTTKKLGDLLVHDVHVDTGSLAVGMPVELAVDNARRATVRANHSATHLLHEALRQVLGDHIAQKGSLVAPDRLRFDFSHPKPISDDELAKVEDIANRVVLENAPVETRLMAVDDAIASGARALFGEKYGDEVRVVSMGNEAGVANAGRAFSIELCGGTHVARTGDIGLVTIVDEGAVASGVRRLEAKTGAGARHHLNARAARLAAVAAVVKAPEDDLAARVSALMDERRRLERELGDARKKLAMGGGEAAAADAPKDIGGVKFLARVMSGLDTKDLKALADEAKKALGSGVVALANTSPDGKGGIVVAVSADLVDRLSAVDFVRVAAETLGGKGGGGRPDMAQAGGPDGAATAAAVAAVEAALRARVVS